MVPTRSNEIVGTLVHLMMLDHTHSGLDDDQSYDEGHHRS